MKTATELLAEMLKIYDEPDKGAAELYLWIHQWQEEIRGAVEQRSGWLEDTKAAFTCPACGGHWFGTSREGGTDDTSRWLVHCHQQYGACDWSGPYDGHIVNETLIDRARGEGE